MGSSPERPLTRLEVVHAIKAAFVPGGVDKRRLFEVAVYHRARPKVGEALQSLPDILFQDLDEVCACLGLLGGVDFRISPPHVA